MKKLNPNSNNNQHPQMKQSQLKESSYGSENSDVLSLTSNNSDIVVNKSEFQVEEFKQKMSHLLGTSMHESLDDLYSKIKERVGSNLINQTSKQLGGMEAALGRVKKNNRQMAKLVTVLGTKTEKSNQRQKMNKSAKKQKGQQTSLKLSKVNSQSSSQFYNYHYKKKGQQSSNSFSGEQGSFLKNRRQSKKEENKLDASENERIRYIKPKVRDTFEEEYKWKNRIYEQKVREMLVELGNIKKELNINKPNKYSTEIEFIEDNRKSSKKTKTISQKTRNSIETRLNVQQLQQQQQKIKQQLQKPQTNASFIPKIAVSEEISIEQIANQNQDRQNKVKNQVKTKTNKVSADTNNTKSNKDSIVKHIKQPNSVQANSLLIEKAKNISKRLQEIKAELTQTTARTPLPSILEEGQKTNIELLGSHNFLSEPSQPFKRRQFEKQSRQNLQQINDKNESNDKDQLQDKPFPKHKLSSKKSVIDEMKNVESKIVISQKKLQEKENFESQQNYNRIQTPNFSVLPQQNNRPQSHFVPNAPNLRPKSNSKPFAVTYSVLSPSNLFTNLPLSSSMVRPPIYRQQPANLNNSVNFISPPRPYETSPVFPVTKFTKPQMFENQSLTRSPSFHRMVYSPLIIPQSHYQNMASLVNRSESSVRLGRSFSEKKLSNSSLNIQYQNFPKIVTSPGVRATKMTETTKADPYIVRLGSSLKRPKSTSSSKSLNRSKGINIHSSNKRL